MHRKKVLIIDDSVTVRVLVQQILAPHYDILTANDGRSGVARALSDRPDLIVLDLVMPEMDGLEVCAALRADKVTKTTPIVMLTSIAEGQKIRVSERRWWSAYCCKPVDGAALLTTIQRCLTGLGVA